MSFHRMPRHRAPRGFTLIELLVAMTLTLLVVLAATAMLTTARQGFNTVDAASQLRDSARLATTIVQRIVDQGGFLDATYASSSRSSEFKVANLLVNPEPPILGFNNARYVQSRVETPNITAFNDGINGSDMLVVRYQSGSTLAGAATSDGSMINCAGMAYSSMPSDRFDRLVSVFHVQNSPTSGEPTLMCSYRTDPTGGGMATYARPVPLVEGVETFQVLFGVDGVVAGMAATATADTVVDQYLRADQLTVPNNITATYLNWQRVRSIRIGMVLRGPPNSALEVEVAEQYPLGGRSFASQSDVGSTIERSTDGRLRQTVTFTMYLRNAQIP